MADDREPVAWGLWNTLLGEWFNPGTRKPYYLSEETARNTIPKAIRQYPMGKWQVREYPLDQDEDAFEETEAPPPEPARPGVSA